MGYVVGDLAGYQAADLHPVVSEAFADYVIPLRVDAASLDALLTRRGWEPAWSFGLFHAERLVGFWLTGRDDSRNEAYCIMTGILPEARGSGGVDAMFARVLAATSARPHRLEVIRGNERAARAYRRLGFRAVVEPWAPAALPPESWLTYPAGWQNRREAQLRALEHASPERVALTTVDAQDHVLCSWLARCGAELTLSQDEMVHDGAEPG
jgi:hypothetical protein